MKLNTARWTPARTHLLLALVMFGSQKNRLAVCHFVGHPVSDDDDLAGLDLCLVVEDAVLEFRHVDRALAPMRHDRRQCATPSSVQKGTEPFQLNVVP